MKIQIESYRDSELTDQQMTEILQLTHSVWPDANKTLAKKVEDFKERIRNNTEQAECTHRVIVRGSDRTLAHASVFPREISFLDSEGNVELETTVLALAGVCTATDHRGRGLGVAVVKKAFEFLDETVSVSLFQTGVPDFYEKLGARVVQNQFINRKDIDNPTANPWWDDHTIIYPGHRPWSKSIVDLNGRGY